MSPEPRAIHYTGHAPKIELHDRRRWFKVSTIVDPRPKSPLAEQLESIRHLRGQSHKTVAGRAGISRAYLHKLERGEVRHPSPPVLAGLATALTVEYDQLMELAGYVTGDVGGLARRRPNPWVLVTPAGTDALTEEEAHELVEYLAWRRHRGGS